MKETTAARLKQIMTEEGLKQVDIIEKSKNLQNKYHIKLGKSALSQYVSGKSKPDQDKLFLLSKVLNVDEAWLMGFDVPRKTTTNTKKGNANNKINRIHRIFSKNLIFLMDNRGIDRNRLVNDLGLKYTTVTDWIKGKTYPRIDKLEMLSDYFGVPKSVFIEDKIENYIGFNTNSNSLSSVMNDKDTISNNTNNLTYMSKNTDDIIETLIKSSIVQEKMLTIQTEILEVANELLTEMRKLNTKLK